MKYGKIVDGEFVEAPKVIKTEEATIFNPPEELLREHGYMELRINELPEDVDGYIWSPSWNEEDGYIIQNWILEPLTLIDPAPSAPVWDVWQGKHFNEGDMCIVEGRTFKAKVAHDATWSRRPVTGINWKDFFQEVIL